MKSWKKIVGVVLATSMVVTAMPNLTFGAVVSGSEADADGYRLVFEDDFTGDTLDRSIWNVETHEAGWVNEEWQQYVDSSDNIYLEDGKLVLKSTKDENGNITSGRVNTQNKETFTYGKFEVRAKVPSGQGLLPAFWLMSNDENVYGQWPRCGEIDCMEVMGQDTSTNYGTIHYGNPHSQKQGVYELTSGDDFAEAFHTYTCEWEPGKISWFVDGVKFYETNDWYSRTEGQGELTYPAPFDQPFYIILNLAVSGSWVGEPNSESDYMNKTFEIDYVKVWQKDSYNEDVEKPVSEVTFREPDATGNYINNGNFAVAEDLTDDQDWKFLTALGGVGSASISANEMNITTEDDGTVDYSIQLVHPNLPMIKGASYKVTFDAYADADRTMIVDISAPDRGYVRYFNDTKLNLSTSKQSYSYEFTMDSDSDANGRLEFNMGHTGSTAGIHISNVKVVKTADPDPSLVNAKSVRADGNYVYNGKFGEGSKHMGDWEVVLKDGNAGLASYGVTDFADGRRLKVSVSADSTELSDVLIKQTDLPVTANSVYAFSFEAQADEEKEITVNVLGTSKTFTIGTSKQTYSVSLPAKASYESKNLVFEVGKPGTIYIDNVVVTEDKLIKNGSFNAGTTGYTVFIDGSADASYVVDSISEDNALDITVKDTSDQDWKVQVKQEGVPLVKGKWYKLSFKAKSSINRDIKVLMQGKEPLGWPSYTKDDIYSLTSEYQTFTKKFEMTDETDADAFLSICLGKLDERITTSHRVVIDDISLVEISAPIPEGANIFKNADFSNGKENWSETIADWEGAAAVSTPVEGGIQYVITNAGTDEWHVQLKQSGIKLEEGTTYKLSMNIVSSEDKFFKTCFMSKSYAWYGGTGDPEELKAGVEKSIEIPFTMTTTDEEADFVISLGKVGGTSVPATVTITDLALVEVKEDTKPSEEPKDDTPEVKEGNLLSNADFANGLTGWVETIANWDSSVTADASHKFIEGGIEYDIVNPGTEDWHVQIKQENVALEAGKTYRIKMDLLSSAARTVKTGLLSKKYAYYGGEDVVLEAGTVKNVDTTFTMEASDSEAVFFISLGKIAGEDTPGSVVQITNLSLEEVKADPDEEKKDEGTEDKKDDIKEDSNDNGNVTVDEKEDDIDDDDEKIVGDDSTVQDNKGTDTSAGKMGDTNALPVAIAITLLGFVIAGIALIRRRYSK